MAEEIQLYAQNRELSWLRFNQRVLEEAKDTRVPLLERLKFVAIFTSNFDEFFMIRVGSLFDVAQTDKKNRDIRSGLTASQQLERIFEETAPLYKERDRVYAEIKKELNPFGICGLDIKELKQQERKYVKKQFKEQILPLLSPQIIDANHPFPHLVNKELYVIASLKMTKGGKEKLLKGIVPVPAFVSEILYLPGKDLRYIRVEKVIMEYLDTVFDPYEVSEANYICVTRNADISPEDEAMDVTEDFRKQMRKALPKRKRMAVVRLETAEKLQPEMEQFFCQKFKITPRQIFRTKMPMKLDYVFALSEKLPEEMRKTFVYPPFSPQPSKQVEPGSMMCQIRKKDVLLFYPYDSMEPFLRLIKEAAYDPSVMTIKITIYRLAKKAKLVEYLCAAAENGKEVTTLIELRARFDEQNNIDWSERLEEAGCRVIYGFEDFKVHSKICLITYRNKGEIQYITQIGTGNYNEKTAAMYTDLSLMTADSRIGRDGAEFFNNMATGNLKGDYRELLVAPFGFKNRILDEMDREIEKGSRGRIIMKMNSLTDVDCMKKLEKASRAGVSVDLLVRGICCILPGVPGHTDNIRVTSIVGRFLEHPRIYSFGEGDCQRIYIGSGDMMTRNTQKRVEVTCPILDQEIRQQIGGYLKVMLSDNVKARVMQMDGSLKKKQEAAALVDSQQVFMDRAMEERPQKKKLPWWKRFWKR